MRYVCGSGVVILQWRWVDRVAPVEQFNCGEFLQSRELYGPSSHSRSATSRFGSGVAVPRDLLVAAATLL